MTEPETDEDLLERMTALFAAAPYSQGAFDDFWDCASVNMDRILDLANRGIKKTRRKEAGRAGGIARMASLSPERRSEIAKQAADARWGNKFILTATGHDLDEAASKYAVTAFNDPASAPPMRQLGESDAAFRTRLLASTPLPPRSQ